MKYFLPILLILCVIAISLSFNDLTRADYPQFRYSLHLIDSKNFYSKQQCWKMVKDKLNLKIKNGKVEF